ncbi:hypothetical protein [Streptomyces sp. NPDC091219]|uniref:hypothetical protein n=1 Tax=Streptomyces sp. NPDC091219 TaxID=3155193 RepID=UPI00344C9F01
MNAVPVLAAYTAAVGFAAPPLLLRAGWTHRAPALAAAVWHILLVSFSIGAALTACNLVMPAEHLEAGMVGLLHSCGLARGQGGPDTHAADRLAAALPAAIGLALAAAFAFHVARSRRARSRHRAAVDLVGRHSARLCSGCLASANNWAGDAVVGVGWFMACFSCGRRRERAAVCRGRGGGDRLPRRGRGGNDQVRHTPRRARAWSDDGVTGTGAERRRAAAAVGCGRVPECAASGRPWTAGSATVTSREG